MPAKKTARTQVRRRTINRTLRSGSRTAVKKADRLIRVGADEATSAVTAAISTLDRAASKGVVHRNAAARGKSRLMRRLHKAAG